MGTSFRNLCAAVLMPALLLVPSGCQTLAEHKTATGAVLGGVVGAAAGAAIDKNNRGRGALIGAAAGAAVGGGIGYYLGRQSKKFQEVPDVQVTEIPGQPGDAAGAPAQTEHLNLRLSSEVLFDTGSSALKSVGNSRLDEIARVLNEYPETRVVVKGFTDSTGTDAGNVDLSKRRAEMIRNYLVGQRVDAARITAVGMGASQPIGDNNTADGRAMNRRVEIEVFPTAQP